MTPGVTAVQVQEYIARRHGFIAERIDAGFAIHYLHSDAGRPATECLVKADSGIERHHVIKTVACG
jgi:hypothetical protein